MELFSYSFVKIPHIRHY